jgi:hypothetical protein
MDYGTITPIRNVLKIKKNLCNPFWNLCNQESERRFFKALYLRGKKKRGGQRDFYFFSTIFSFFPGREAAIALFSGLAISVSFIL